MLPGALSSWFGIDESPGIDLFVRAEDAAGSLIRFWISMRQILAQIRLIEDDPSEL